VALTVGLVDRGRAAALRRPYLAGLLHGAAVMLVLTMSCVGCMREVVLIEASDGSEGGDTGDDAAGTAASAEATSSTTHQGGSGDADATSAADESTGGGALTGDTGEGMGDAGSEESGPASSDAGSSTSDGSTGGPPEPGLWGTCYEDGGDYVCPGDDLCVHDGGGQASPNLCVPPCVVAEGACETPWGDGVCWDTGIPGGAGNCIVPCTMDGCPDILQCIAWGPDQVLVCVMPEGK
jgi:hypothetical protein